MAESLQLLSRQREEELRRAADARDLQAEQQRWIALTDDYHQQIRNAADRAGRKAIATDLGVDLSTVSNWLSCESGRGFPPPRLLLYLRQRAAELSSWEAEHARVAIDESAALTEIERDVLPELGKRDADRVRAILRRIRKGTR